MIMTQQEREFWQSVYSAAVAAGHADPKAEADAALVHFRGTHAPDESYKMVQDRMADAGSRQELPTAKFRD